MTPTAGAASGRLKPVIESGRGRRRSALTLLEMLLVLAILVVVVSLSFPAVDRMYRTHRLRETANEIRARLAATRLRAAQEGIAYQFRYEPGGRRMLAIPHAETGIRFDQSANGSGADRSPWSFAARLPPGWKFATRDPRRERLPSRRGEMLVPAGRSETRSAAGNAAWSAPLVFAPHGGATPAEFDIVDGQGRFVRLSVRQLTGVVSISPAQQQEAR